MNIKYVNEVLELLRKYNGKILKFNIDSGLKSQRFKFKSGGCRYIANVEIKYNQSSSFKLTIGVGTYGCIADDKYMQIAKMGNSTYEKDREEDISHVSKFYSKDLYVVCIPFFIDGEPKYKIEVLKDVEYDMIIKALDLIKDYKSRAKDILYNILDDKTIEI